MSDSSSTTYLYNTLLEYCNEQTKTSSLKCLLILPSGKEHQQHDIKVELICNLTPHILLRMMISLQGQISLAFLKSFGSVGRFDILTFPGH